MNTAHTATAIITVDLAAIGRNWRRIRSRLGPGQRAAGVVKADAYGCGARRVVPALAAAGCRDFFVAQIDEALAIRDLIPADGRLFVLSGPPPGTAAVMRAEGVIPVLNTPDQIADWIAANRAAGAPAPSAVQVDSGMTRLGLDPADLAALAADAGQRAWTAPVLLMSHLACADDPAHPMNARQRDAFADAAATLPGVPTSLANSAGVFLGPEWQGDLVRPGIALYGGNPTPGRPNPMEQVLRLQAKILQVRQIDSPRVVGYGARHRAPAGRRLATVGLGYADGYPRAAGSRAWGWLPNSGEAAGPADDPAMLPGPAATAPGESGQPPGWRVPLVGRVSMDLLTLDVTAAPETRARPGAMIDLLGPRCDIDALAAAADTIGYEILTRLAGARGLRLWQGDSGGGECGDEGGAGAQPAEGGV